ncbi:hypothetical protein GOP47_0023283 [Adiantum capillus-veneris]|uniref:U-box domain-containing protein n=1 Tax=Adiantum capillus-veneris TaxID=13818 RepID=A0A9D4U8Z8_ADICA|nr:hypothetical protein GOP47_0023283 [Adiantum capillus-veneris]
MPSLMRNSYKAMLGLLRPASVTISSPSGARPRADHIAPAVIDRNELRPAPAAKLPLCLCHEGPSGGIDNPQLNESSISCTDADLATATSSDSSSCSLTFDVNSSLDIFLQTMPHLNDIQDQIRILDTTCNACSSVAKPIIIDRRVATGCVAVILNLLSTPDAHAHCLTAPMGARQTEKALLLLDLITTESEAGCTTVLQRCSSVINTLGRKLLRISETCTASVMAILVTLCSKSDGESFRQAISKTAIPSKLVLVLQVASKGSTKQSAGKLLQLLHAQPP